MEALGPIHPAIVHAPIALIVTSLLFELIGRATDLDWWRRAAAAMLAIGVLGAGLAVLSGKAAEEPAERQGVPEAPIESHESAAFLTLAAGLAAVVARAVASRLGPMRAAARGLALLLHVVAAALVIVTGARGGDLVFEHAAGVKLHGELLRSGPPREPTIGETAKSVEPHDSAATR